MRSIQRKIHAGIKSRAVTTFHTRCSVTLYTQVVAVDTGTNTGPRIRTLKPRVLGSGAVSHHQLQSLASDRRPAVRLPTNKTPREKGDTRSLRLRLHRHIHHSTSSEDCSGGDTRARQQATRQHSTGERCARVTDPAFESSTMARDRSTRPRFRPVTATDDKHVRGRRKIDGQPASTQHWQMSLTLRYINRCGRDIASSI